MTKIKKKKSSDEMNGKIDHTQNTNQGNASSQVETSSQEELSTPTSKRKPYNILPPEYQPKSKMANLSTTPKPTPDDNNSTSSDDSDRLVVEEPRQLTNDLNSTNITDTTNVTRDLSLDVASSDNETETHPDEEVTEPNIIESYTLILPSIKDALGEPETEQGNKVGRITRKGKYAHAVLNQRLGSGNHTKEKERQHSTKERQKTLFGSYEISEGNADSFSNLDLLQVTAKHIKQKDIEAFYKTAEGKFIILLLDSDLKETYAHELNFQEKIRNNTVNFRILHNIPCPRISGGQNKNDPTLSL